ncbi:MAG: HDIG domain-containing protein [Candidatus Eremiobacteraeota bacterium]|nr:HDIG domain-containing protein [Candidatus Eremiobacteraeota bacterium]
MGNSWVWLLAGGLAGAILGRPKPEEKSPEKPSEVPPPAPPARPEPVEDPRTPQILEDLVQEIKIKNREALEQVARKDWEELAARQIAQAMQRLVVHEVSQHSLSSLRLPSDDYKGRIIGKEGRNLRLFESLTGVDIVIDDTPNSVTLSCFDPFRREIARQAMERLIQDGRFQPQRIEEAVQRARSEVTNQLQEKGRQAVSNLKLKKLHPQLNEALGRLAFRTSYRQNVLEHSQEVAHLCAHLAAELGGDVETAKRAGLLHDIGKGLTDPGPHAVTGAALCRRYGESEQVCHAVEAHHEDVRQTTLEATLVQVADAISAARPGARRENTQEYMERMETMESLARRLPHVVECQVIQAGREIRVFVRPDSADDEECMKLASRLADDIGAAVTRPGPVRVTVLRQFQASAQVE